MYPATFFGLFPPFPRDDQAFVAMSFDKRFDDRWKNVIAPAMSNVTVGEKPLTAHRVDLSKAGDSVLTQILDRIGRARVIVADITALGKIDTNVVRNQNVFYEVGIAHATRLPEEGLLFRSDDEPLAFDISNVRVHYYDPEGDPDKARTIMAELVVASLTELDLRRSLVVRRAAEQLDDDSFAVLLEAQIGVSVPDRTTVRTALSGALRMDAICRLLEMGAIAAKFNRVIPENLKPDSPMNWVTYTSTAFGSVLCHYVLDATGMNDPLIQNALKEGFNPESNPSSSPPAPPSVSADANKDQP